MALPGASAIKISMLNHSEGTLGETHTLSCITTDHDITNYEQTIQMTEKAQNITEGIAINGVKGWGGKK